METIEQEKFTPDIDLKPLNTQDQSYNDNTDLEITVEKASIETTRNVKILYFII